MRTVRYDDSYQHLVIDFACGNFIIDNFLKSSDALGGIH